MSASYNPSLTFTSNQAVTHQYNRNTTSSKMKLSELSSLLLFSFIPCILGVIPEWLRKDPVDDPEMVRQSQPILPKLSDEMSQEVSKELQLFQDFIRTYEKVYADEEEFRKRFHIFRENLNKIEQLRESEQGTAQYDITQFSDLTDTEMKRHLGFIPQQTTHELPQAEIPDITLPDHFDWRAHNAVTPVKDQKHCGSCWAFSVMGNIEGQWALNKGELFSLSVQELLDCDDVDLGCRGGNPSLAFYEIIKLGGIETDDDYPYKAKNGTCKFKKSKAEVQIDGMVIFSPDEMKIAKWLVKNGPVSVSINASPFFHYKEGIAHPNKTTCKPFILNHAVLIVGLGVDYSSSANEGIPYWIIKNSWGTKWGEKGYFRLYRGDNTCGINSYALSAIVLP